MERHYHIGQEASSGTFYERYDMSPPTPILITLPLPICVHHVSSFPLCLISVSLRFVPHTTLAFVSSATEVGVYFNHYMVSRHLYFRLLSILVCLSKDVTGALGMQSGTQLFLIYNCQVPHDPCRKVTSILVCLSKDVTGALVCSW